MVNYCDEEVVLLCILCIPRALRTPSLLPTPLNPPPPHTHRLYQQLQDFHINMRVLLTGTPLQNTIQELFMLMHFLDTSKFSNLQVEGQEMDDISRQAKVAQLHELLSPHVLRRVKKDVLKQLPPKKELILRVELTPLQKEYYRSVLTRSFPVLSNKAAAPRLKNVLMELRKCCNHPFLFEVSRVGGCVGCLKLRIHQVLAVPPQQ